MKNKFSILGLLVLTGTLLPTLALAEHPMATTTIYCPSKAAMKADMVVSLDPSQIESGADYEFQATPCAGIRVVAMAPSIGWDGTCGVAYTDSTGRVSIPLDCPWYVSASTIYLRVEGHSVLGFNVGTHSYSWLDGLRDAVLAAGTFGAAIPEEVYNYFRSHETFVWTSEEKPLKGNAVDFGNLAIGEGDSVSVKAGRTFWLAQYAMSRFTSGTQYQPMDFNYTVDSAIGSPTTLWDTVVDRDDNNNKHRLEEAPHEIGHVFYNSFHSDEVHWMKDATSYMSNHSACSGQSLTRMMAWYEGFADFMRDYAYQNYSWPYHGDDWYNRKPPSGCGNSDMSDEGNVEGLLNTIFYGPLDSIPPVTLGACPAGFSKKSVGSPAHDECVKSARPTCDAGRTLVVDHDLVSDQCYNPLGVPNQKFTILCTQNSCPNGPQYIAPKCTAPAILTVLQGADSCVTQQPLPSSIDNTSPVPRADGSPNLVPGHDTSYTLGWFAVPELDRVMEWVQREGANSHRASEFWNNRIRNWCSNPGEGAYPNYCDVTKSPDFSSHLTVLDSNLR